ncbi:hypothetical protein HQ865_01360 [Mucilaginibacter mali]|uniref:Uncharacterized protein n=1 Tax=Mucilaginibacter mali TaxID=2740462 RepID=A0A7D4PRU6_9SPHI|nr:hypothetical protein [Mucilaginibacter mali]QKJ28463.1 hypothetical protein HQ865_01360 [Mucilaginibacter mali]
MKKIDLKNLIDEELARQGKTFKWLVNELDMSFDGLKAGLAGESIKLRDLKKLISVLNMPIHAFFEEGSTFQSIVGDRNNQANHSVLNEPVVKYQVENLQQKVEMLEKQVKDKEEIIQLLRMQKQ